MTLHPVLPLCCAALCAAVAISIPSPAFAQAVPKAAPNPAASIDLDELVKDSVKKAAEFLWTRQNTTKVRLVKRYLTNRPEIIDVECAWKDVFIVKGTTTVRIKGKEYTEVEVVIPPGWFEAEPPMSDLPKTVPPPPGYGDINPYYGGSTALATLALLSTRDYNPNKDPRMKMALECLANLHMVEAVPPPGTKPEKPAPAEWMKWNKVLVPGVLPNYVTSLRLVAMEQAIRRGATGELRTQLMRTMNADYQKLAKGFGEDGHNYLPKVFDAGPPINTPAKWDLSNTQYAILAMWAAARVPLETDNKVWEHFNRLLVAEQQKDGGWGYSAVEPASTLTMATAGIASLFVIMDQLHTRTRGYNGPDVSPFSANPLLLRTLQSIDRGLDSFGRVYRPAPDGYYMYGVERIGEASGYKYFGDHDWFREGVAIMLGSQSPQGAYTLRSPGLTIGTAYGILFLVHGRGPILLNKLHYGDSADWQWNNYPRDCANLVRAYDRKYEAEANWQVVPLQKNREADLQDAHILYINGYKPVSFADDEVDMLRRYVEGGGTLLFANCGGKDKGRKFNDSVIELSKRLYPPADFPEYRLSSLPKDHFVYTGGIVLADVKGPRPPDLSRLDVWHMHNGHRSFLFMFPDDIVHLWHTNRFLTRQDAYQIFYNIRDYATDKGPLPPRFRPSGYPGAPAEAKGAIKIGTVRYTSRGVVQVDAELGAKDLKKEPVTARGDWNAGAGAWRSFAPWMRHHSGWDVTETRGIALTDPALKGHDLLHMAGHYGFTMSPDELAALKAYIAGGGTVLLELVGGRDMDGKRDFFTSARALAKELGGTAEQLSAVHPTLSGKFAAGGGFDCAQTQFSRRMALGGNTTPTLLGVKVDGRIAVLVSPHDLSCILTRGTFWERDGYTLRSARELATNILLYAKQGK